MKCSECKFFVEVRHQHGECRRMPPVSPPDDSSQRGAFPIVYQGSWCGEHQLSDKARQATRDGYDVIAAMGAMLYGEG